MAQLVKNLPAMWETLNRSLDWEDPLEKGTATILVFWPGEFHGLSYFHFPGKEKIRGVGSEFFRCAIYSSSETFKKNWSPVTAHY